MRAQRRLSFVVAVAVLTLVAGLGASGAVAVGQAESAAPVVAGGTGSWTGLDGKEHSDAPNVIPATAGSRHFLPGWDFDDACWSGERFERGLAIMQSIARVIRRSGRKVLWTVSPNKASGRPDLIDMGTLPHGACALQGLDAQETQLDNVQSPSYIPVRSMIAKSPRQTFWRSDPHWTSVGASIWVKEVARRLSPELARQQKWYSTKASLLGLMYAWQGRTDAETAPAVRPKRFVRVQRTHGIDPVEALRSQLDLSAESLDLGWKTRPIRKTWRGKTLLVGDSMTFFALELMRPMFQRGRFLWISLNKPEVIAKAVVESDTVVLELLQRGLSIHQLLELPQLRAAIAAALKNAPKR